MNIGPTTRSDLDSFESSLLGELRSAVGTRNPQPARRHRLPALAAAVVVGALAITGGTTLLRPDAAFAVTEQSDGDIVVTIHRLDDTDGLERALADHGITADVDFDASDAQTEPAPAGDLTPVDPDDVTTLPDGGESVAVDGQGNVLAPGEAPFGADDPCGFTSTTLTTAIQGSDFVITIPQDSVLNDPGKTLKITNSGNIDENWAGMSVEFTNGDSQCGVATAEAGAIPAS